MHFMMGKSNLGREQIQVYRIWCYDFPRFLLPLGEEIKWNKNAQWDGILEYRDDQTMNNKTCFSPQSTNEMLDFRINLCQIIILL